MDLIAGKKQRKIVLRTNYLSNSRVQLEFIIYFVAALCLVIGILYLKVREILADLQSLGSTGTPADIQNLFPAAQLTVNWLFVLCTVNAVIFVFVGGIFFTHRLAGPITAMKKYFSEIQGSGRITRPLSFRKNDYFSELPLEINNALERLAPEKIDRASPAETVKKGDPA